MENSIKNELEEILHNYPIHYNRILTLKFERIWQIDAKEGCFILKALSYPKEETEFIIGAMVHLQKQGFKNFNEILPTVDQQNTVALNSKFYFLTKKIEGREASYLNPSDAENLGKFLGKFHLASQGYTPINPYPGRVKWGNWSQMIESKKCDLIEFKEQSPKTGDFNSVFCRFTPYYLDEAKKAQIHFQTKEYQALSQRQNKLGGFCHHDLAHHNFILNETPNLIDFDYVIADIRSHDIANLLCKILKANHWDTDIAMKALTFYDKVSPLDTDEIPIIKAMLRFPQDFWQCAFAHYKEGELSSRNGKKLKHWLKERTLRRDALNKLENLF